MLAPCFDTFPEHHFRPLNRLFYDNPLLAVWVLRRPVMITAVSHPSESDFYSGMRATAFVDPDLR